MNSLTRLLIPIAALASKLFAQTPRVEAGLHLGATGARVLGEKPLAAGGTFTVRLFRFIDAEAGVTRIPIGGTVALFPATQATFGARLGRRWGPLGLYGKVRPGFTRFDTNAYVPNLGTRPALDIGGIIELYSHRHFAARVDFGDNVVWYGNEIRIPIISAPGNRVPGTRHQFQTTVGISAWF